MHGCSGHIECISAWAREVNSIPDAFVKCLDDPIHVSAAPLYDDIIVRCSLICTINKSAYLNVNPDYVWLTPDMLSSGEFDIISNIKWNIV